MADWLKAAQEVLASCELATLATVSGEGSPRAVTVKAALSGGLFDWRSKPSRTHSAHVAENPSIAFNFYDPSTRSAVYGIGQVESAEDDVDEHIHYVARVSEAIFVTDQKIDGEFVPPQALDPTKL